MIPVIENTEKRDIVEYAEKVLGVKLLDWQKEYLRKLVQLPPGSTMRVYVPRIGPSSLCFEHLRQLMEILYPSEGEEKKMTNNKAIELIRKHIAMLKDHPITYDDGGWGSRDIFDALDTAIGALEETFGDCSIEEWNEKDSKYIYNINYGYEWFEIKKDEDVDWELYLATKYRGDGLNYSLLYSSSDVQECVEYAMRYAKENLYDR